MVWLVTGIMVEGVSVGVMRYDMTGCVLTIGYIMTWCEVTECYGRMCDDRVI